MIETNKVYCMDALEYLKQIPDKVIDIMLIDPPYGIDIGSMNFTQSGAIKVGGAYRNDYTNHDCSWDKETLNEDKIKEIFRVSKNQIIFGANHFANLLPNTKGWVVWDKRCEDKYSNDFADGELIWTSFDKPLKIIRYLWSGMIQDEMGLHKEKRYHPTQKPVELIRRLLKTFAKEKDVICDCFMGSGTTAVACKQLGYTWYGCEIQQQYIDITLTRLNQKSLLEVFQ